MRLISVIRWKLFIDVRRYFPASALEAVLYGSLEARAEITKQVFCEHG